MGNVYGSLCECDDFSCVRGANDALCSGHGDCVCGQCRCSDDWTGEDCSCTKLTDQCQHPLIADTCSGSGQCQCNTCQCGAPSQGQVYTGEFCELSPGETRPCLAVKDCVECLAFGTGEYQKEDCQTSCQFELEEKAVSAVGQSSGPNTCIAYNSNGCLFSYEFGEDDGEVFIHVVPQQTDQRDEGKGEVIKESCAQVNTLGVTLGVFGAVLLLGLLGICAFKGIQMLQYRRECAHFERLVQEAKYATNQTPNEMYRSPITTYKNPMYGIAKPDR